MRQTELTEVFKPLLAQSVMKSVLQWPHLDPYPRAATNLRRLKPTIKVTSHSWLNKNKSRRKMRMLSNKEVKSPRIG